jgi:hypothetical protein
MPEGEYRGAARARAFAYARRRAAAIRPAAGPARGGARQVEHFGALAVKPGKAGNPGHAGTRRAAGGGGARGGARSAPPRRGVALDAGVGAALGRARRLGALGLPPGRPYARPKRTGAGLKGASQSPRGCRAWPAAPPRLVRCAADAAADGAKHIARLASQRRPRFWGKARAGRFGPAARARAQPSTGGGADARRWLALAPGGAARLAARQWRSFVGGLCVGTDTRRQGARLNTGHAGLGASAPAPSAPRRAAARRASRLRLHRDRRRGGGRAVAAGGRAGRALGRRRAPVCRRRRRRRRRAVRARRARGGVVGVVLLLVAD